MPYPMRRGVEKHRFYGELESKRADICVVIFGSYFENNLSFLESLRDSLREGGYKKTYLVKDLFPDSPLEESPTNSLNALHFSDVNVFVFTFEGQEGGGNYEFREWSHVLEHPELYPELLLKSLRYVETRKIEGEETFALGNTYLSELKHLQLSFGPFSDLDNLTQDVLRDLEYRLTSR